MKLTFLGALAVALAAILLVTGSDSWSGQARAAAVPTPAAINGQYIVLFNHGVDPATETARLERGLGFRANHVYTAAVQGFSAKLSERAVDALRHNPNVALVEADRVMRAFPQSEPTGILRAQADQNATANIDNSDDPMAVDVAVIDTGSGPHSELNVAGGYASYGQCTGNWIEVLYCQLGLIAPTCSISDSYADGHGHGTHVAGTIAAKDNNTGVVGMAPGANIWSVRVLGPEGIGCNSDVIAGVDWVTAHAATIDVANMSLGGPNSAALCTAIANSVAAGVTYAVAAGNSSVDAANASPANCSSAITVSAIADYNGAPGGGAGATCADYGPDDSFASFSNYGSVVDIAAPGVCINSTWLGGGYNTISGTSMATPHVTGAAALLKAQNPGWSPAQVRTALLANSFQPGSACYFTGDPDGVAEPLLNVGPACPLDGPTAPTVTINQAAGQGDPTNVSPVNFTVAFSEAVAGFDGSDVALGGTAGATTVVVTGGPTTYNVAVSGMSSDGTVMATIPAGAANAVDGGLASEASTSTDNVVTYDTTAPTVTIDQASGQQDPTGTSPINFTAVFSEPVTGFSGSDVALGGTAGATTAVVSGGPTTYDIAVSGMTADGTVTASIGAGVAFDGAGNGNAASTSTDNTVNYEGFSAPPALSITSIDPDSATSGSTVGATVSGTGFAAGVTVSFEGGSGPAPTAVVTSSSSSSLTVTVTVKAGGPPRVRTWDVRVTNPDGPTAVLPGGFTVNP